MDMSFKEFISSPVYERHASQYAKAMIFVSTIVLIISAMFFREIGIFSVAVLFFGWSVIGVSYLLAMPLFLLRSIIIVQMMPHTSFPDGVPIDGFGKALRMLSNIVVQLGYISNVFLTYYISGLFA